MLPKLFGINFTTFAHKEIEEDSIAEASRHVAQEIKKFPANNCRREFYPISSHCPQPTPWPPPVRQPLHHAGAPTQDQKDPASQWAAQPPSDCCNILPWKELTAASQQAGCSHGLSFRPLHRQCWNRDIYPAQHSEPEGEALKIRAGWARCTSDMTILGEQLSWEQPHRTWARCLFSGHLLEEQRSLVTTQNTKNTPQRAIPANQAFSGRVTCVLR